jgi:photosystem II stability/assembly factor-like uncharacterized protein
MMKKIFIFLLAVLILFVSSYGQEFQWVWQNPLPQRNTLYSSQFIDSNNGLIVGSCGTILRTNNGGKSWNIQQSDTSEDLFSFHFFDTFNGLIVGGNGTILKTVDSGITWSKQETGTNSDLFSVHVIDTQNGYIVGDNGTSLKHLIVVILGQN